MSKENTVRAGDRAYTKVGRNLVEVVVMDRIDSTWKVKSHTGRTFYARAVQTADGKPVTAFARTDGAAPSAKAATAAAPAKRAATPKAAAAPSPKAVPQKGLGLLSAAAAVLERAGEAMSVKAMIEGAKAAGLWTPGTGKTPEQTLYSAIIREIKDKGDASRFRKEGRGRFAFAL